MMVSGKGIFAQAGVEPSHQMERPGNWRDMLLIMVIVIVIMIVDRLLFGAWGPQ